MGGKGKETAQRLLAIIVIMAMLGIMGIPLTVIFFFAVVVYFVWRAVQRSDQQDIRNIFEFYIAANEILRDEERRWYGFEIASAIERGDAILRTMTDPPPLVYFTLGALYHRAGDHEAATEHLAFVLENEQGDESHRFAYSQDLRRYVQVLRRLEREPAEAPQTMAAIRSLDRARRTRAAAMLEESRRHLGSLSTNPALPRAVSAAKESGVASQDKNANSRQPTLSPAPPVPAPAPRMPPPISEVLHDLYEEEKRTA